MTFFLVKTRVKIVRQMIQVTNQIKEHQKFGIESSRSDLNALVSVFHNVKLGLRIHFRMQINLRTVKQG